MTAEIAVLLVEKVTCFKEFGFLNSSWIRRSFILMFLSFSRLLFQNSVTDVFVGFRPSGPYNDSDPYL